MSAGKSAMAVLAAGGATYLIIRYSGGWGKKHGGTNPPGSGPTEWTPIPLGPTKVYTPVHLPPPITKLPPVDQFWANCNCYFEQWTAPKWIYTELQQPMLNAVPHGTKWSMSTDPLVYDLDPGQLPVWDAQTKTCKFWVGNGANPTTPTSERWLYLLPGGLDPLNDCDSNNGSQPSSSHG